MQRQRHAILVLAAGAAFLLAWTAGSSTTDVADSPTPTPSQNAGIEAARHEAIRRARPKLDWADAECQRVAGKELAAIDRFFDGASARTPAFAKQMLGWGSKWRFVADRLPLTRGDRHDQFLRAAFHEHLFTPEQLAQVVEQAIRNEMDAVAGIENQMLVRIRADLADLQQPLLPQLADESQWAASYEQALLAAHERIGGSLKSDLSSEMVSLIAGEVMTLVAVRLGVSAGILAAGAGSSAATFGIGLVVGIIVDQLVAWVWDWWKDPRGELAAAVRGKLDEIRHLILDGDATTPGLRSRLDQFVQDRAQLRREAVLTLLNSAGASP